LLHASNAGLVVHSFSDALHIHLLTLVLPASAGHSVICATILCLLHVITVKLYSYCSIVCS